MRDIERTLQFRSDTKKTRRKEVIYMNGFG
jgi:hypothetical protein